MANKFTTKRYAAEILEELYNTVQSKKKSRYSEYKQVGYSDVQATHWKTGELLWEDDEKTVPRYSPIYEDVPIPEDELSDESKAYIEACDDIMAYLLKLV